MYILKTVQMVNIIVNGSLRRNVKPCRKADQNVFQGSV